MSSLDAGEIAKFEAMAGEWWNPQGKFKPLHLMNPCRLDYISGQIAWHFDRDLMTPLALEGLEIVDIGCGGGLLSEPMKRLGARITGIDAAPTNIEVAKLHAAKQGLDIDYRHALAEDLATEGEQFDAVLAMEIVEHVAEPSAFLATIAALLKPGGIMIMSTINRTPKSFALAIIGAEYVMRWLPIGTHDWNKFITPEELTKMSEKAGLEVKDRIGMVLNPLTNAWSLSHQRLGVNYAITALK